MNENPFSKEKKGPKIVSEIRLKRGASGHLTAERHHENYEHPPEAKSFKPSEGKAFMAHVAKHMGIKGEPEPGEENAAPEAD